MTAGTATDWPRRTAAGILIAGWVTMVALGAPGQLSYDSVTQLADGRSGEYDTWHPPVMAALLGLFDRILVSETQSDDALCRRDPTSMRAEK